MRNLIEYGETLNFTAAADVVAGQAVLVGKVLVVSYGDVPNGQSGPGAAEGVYALPKATGAITQGAQLYWDATAKNVTTTATSNTAVGKAWRDAASGDATVQIKINV